MSQEMLDALMKINLLGGDELTDADVAEIVKLWHALTDRRESM